MNIHAPYLTQGAKPTFRKGSTHAACLCIHGFSAAPAEINWLGEHLHQTLGITTYTPRLAGHGTTPEDMRRMRWRDWYMSVRDGYELLANQCDHVYIAGISMGGLLTLLLASAQDTQPAGLAVIATPVVYTHNRVAQAQLLKWFIRMKDMPDNSSLPGIVREEQERRGEDVIGRTHYNRWSISAVAELHDLTLAVRDNLETVSAPLTMIFAENDHSVSLESADVIQQTVQSSVIEKYTLSNCGHIITQDIERDDAFEIVEDFFRRQIEKELETA